MADSMDESRRRLERALGAGDLKRGERAPRVEVLPPEKRGGSLQSARAMRARGVLYAVAASTLALVGLMQARRLWWLLFVAWGLGSAALRYFNRASELREPAPVPPPPLADPRDERVDALCAKLQTELSGGPKLLREVLDQPEKTIEALRRSCLELTRRERELRAHLASRSPLDLQREHESLASRVAAETDPITRERLQGALTAVEEQQRQRAEIERAASRIEAEHTRLAWTLENLHSQVIRVKSADAGSLDVAGASLRQTVEQLGSEMNAIADALEAVHRERS